MKAALAAYRQANDVQYNRPNPNVDEARFRELYVAVDTSKFDPLTADEQTWQTIHAWRQRMREATQG
jgi:hypothetical protein